MQQNRVKKILREGGLALGTHVGGIPDPQIVELIGLAGFDAAARRVGLASRAGGREP